MSTKQQDILNTQLNAGEANNSNSLSKNFNRHQIGNGPFWALGTEEDGYHIVIGTHRVTEEPIHKEETEDYLEKNLWRVIIQLIAIMVESTYISEAGNIPETNK